MVAAVDLDFKKALKFIDKEHAYKNTEEMYQSEDIDVVYIATPPNLHKSMIEEALKENKHVLCEKPVSASIDDAREILKLNRKYPKLKIGFNYQYRYDENCYNLVQGIINQHLGKIYYANCNVFFSRKKSYFRKGGWRVKKESTGGGTLLSHGSHILDVLIWAFGEPMEVLGKIDNLKFKDLETEDVGFGIIKFKNNSYIQINCSMITQAKKKFKELIEVDIFGEKGNCSYNGPWPFSSLKWHKVENYIIQRNPPSSSDYSECLNSFCNWILKDDPFLNTVEESSKVLRVVKSIYKSSETGSAQPVLPLL